MLDDEDDADVLTHLIPSIHFIQAELDKGRGVLVHCMAGVSCVVDVLFLKELKSKALFRSQHNYSGSVLDVQQENRCSVGTAAYQKSPTYHRVRLIKSLSF